MIFSKLPLDLIDHILDFILPDEQYLLSKTLVKSLCLNGRMDDDLVKNTELITRRFLPRSISLLDDFYEVIRKYKTDNNKKTIWIKFFYTRFNETYLIWTLEEGDLLHLYLDSYVGFIFKCWDWKIQYRTIKFCKERGDFDKLERIRLDYSYRNDNSFWREEGYQKIGQQIGYIGKLLFGNKIKWECKSFARWMKEKKLGHVYLFKGCDQIWCSGKDSVRKWLKMERLSRQQLSDQ